MERLIIIRGKPCSLFSMWQNQKTHAAPKSFSGDRVGFERFLKRIFAESAKRYRRSARQRSRGVATAATGLSGGGVAREDLHR
jgi:hypothetical protein